MFQFIAPVFVLILLRILLLPPEMQRKSSGVLMVLPTARERSST